MKKRILIAILFLSHLAFGQAVSLDGTNFVQFPDRPEFSYTPGQSIAYIGQFNYCTDGHIFNQHYCGDYDNGQGGDNQKDAGYGLEVTPEGNLRFYAQLQEECNVSTNFISLVSPIAGLNDNSWHSFVIQVNTTASTVQIDMSVDGAVVASTPVIAGFINDSDAPFNFGTYVNAVDSYLDLPEGRIGDLTIIRNVELFQFDLTGALSFNTSVPGDYYTVTPGTSMEAITPAVFLPDDLVLSDVDLGPDQVICLGETIDLFAGTTGATSYEWSQGEGGSTPTLLPGVTGSTYSFTPTAPGTYDITVSASLYSCTETDEITVVVNPTPTFDIPTEFCLDSDPYWLHLFAMPTGALDLDFIGDIYEGHGIEVLSSGFWFNPEGLAPGTYNFSACYIPVSGGMPCCKDFVVNILNPPTPLFTEEVLCVTDSPVTLFSFPYDGVSHHPYEATGENPDTDEAINFQFDGTTGSYVFDPSMAGPGDHTITLCEENGDANCCTDIEITVCAAPDFDLNWDGCDLITADVHVTPGGCGGPYTYDWSGPGISFVGTDFINVNAIGLYSCTVTNAAGCSTTLEVGVKCDPPKVKITSNVECDLPATISAAVTSSCYIVSTVWTNSSGAVVGHGYNLEASEEGFYSFTATDALGCSTTVTYLLEIPEVEILFDPIAPISLCDDPSPITISYTSDGDYCDWISFPAGFDPLTSVFDPFVAGPGDYEFVLNCYIGNCVSTDTLHVQVLNDLFWHQTTSNAFQNDIINDVVTDDEGNVYVTGTFYGFTDLTNSVTSVDYTISTVDPGSHSAFIAKYSKCGELLWITHERGNYGTFSEGIDLEIDNENNYLYVVGNFYQDMYLIDGTGPDPACGAITALSAIGGQSGFITRLNSDNGCVLFLDGIAPTSGTKLTSVCINQSSTIGTNCELFISGKIKTAGPPSALDGTNGFIFKYNVSNSPVASLPTNTWFRSVVGASNSYQIINSIDYDEGFGRVWATGTYRKQLVVSGGPSITEPAGVESEKAFILSFNNLGGASSHYWTERMTPADRTSYGEDISVDEISGNVYITGSFYEDHSNPFGYMGETWPNDATSNAYHMSLRSYPGTTIPTFNWSRESDAGLTGAGNNAEGSGVSFVNGKAHFVGNYTSDLSVESSGGTTENLLYTLGTLGNNSHVFTVSFDQLNGTASDLNATSDVVGGSEHVSTAIHANANGKSFVVGKYTGQMNYQIGTPISGPLVSDVSLYNAFVMRVDRDASGAYRSSQSDESYESEPIQLSENGFELSIYPNPTQGAFKVDIENFDMLTNYTVQLRSVTGRLIWSQQLENAQSSFDISEFENGMYILNITDGTDTIIERIVKQ